VIEKQHSGKSLIAVARTYIITVLVPADTTGTVVGLREPCHQNFDFDNVLPRDKAGCDIVECIWVAPYIATCVWKKDEVSSYLRGCVYTR